MNGATTIQERLKDLRLNKGLKLEELAEQTGISKSALGSYEKDDYKEINHGNLILLADFYGVSLDYLFCRTENRAEINTPLRELHLVKIERLSAWDTRRRPRKSEPENVAERGLESHAGRTAHSISSGQNDHLIGGITQNVIHQKHLLRYSSYHVGILTTWSELT